jgi:hypothetical protein
MDSLILTLSAAWLLSVLCGAGLWVVLFRSPMVPHLLGGLAYDRQALEDFMLRGMLSSRVPWLFEFLHELWTCRTCQSIHCSWVPCLCVWLFFGLPLGALIFAIPAAVAVLNLYCDR